MKKQAGLYEVTKTLHTRGLLFGHPPHLGINIFFFCGDRPFFKIFILNPLKWNRRQLHPQSVLNVRGALSLLVRVFIFRLNGWKCVF